jgi:hypothetical protein
MQSEDFDFIPHEFRGAKIVNKLQLWVAGAEVTTRCVDKTRNSSAYQYRRTFLIHGYPFELSDFDCSMERVYQTRERVRQAFVILAENRYVKRNQSRTVGTILTIA